MARSSLILALMSTPVKFSRKNPCIARLKRMERLSLEGSTKDTRHIEIDLCGSGLTFEPGDSLAVQSRNCPDLVDEIIAALGADPEVTVTGPDKEEQPLRDCLLTVCAVTQPDKKFLAALAEKAGAASDEWRDLLVPDKKKELADYLWGREIIDFLLACPHAKFEPQEFVSLLRKLQVRLYSIASSLKAVPDEVHLTVATVEYESFGRERKGVCSTFLAHRIDESTPIPCFITPGKGFRLPEPEDDTPIVMVGPGTGIAPFRAFMQERAAANAKGKAWLIFGERQRATEFFYEKEWEKYMADGVLDRLDTAFSRDQDHKIYVQDRLRENSALLWEWLEQGAIVYVCGDASRMASDVDKALHDVIAEEGGKSAEEAEEYVKQMHADKRYRRDVY